MRSESRRILLAGMMCAVVLGGARPAAAQEIEKSFRTDIEKLLEVTGSARMGVQAATAITAQFLEILKQSGAVPERAMDVAKQVLDAEFGKAFTGPDGILEQTVRIYARHFTHEDVRGLLAFYGTDLGKKMISVMPSVFQEAMAAGQQWAEREWPRIQKTLESRLRAEGFIK